MSKPRLVTGITATGKITLGNYIGAIKQLIALQDRYELFVFVADLHALTIEIDAKTLVSNRQQIAALYLACGLDPKKVTLFYQSDVPAHTQLAWIMQNIVTVGELSRMTQFKDKGQKQANQTTQIRGGLLTYPTLMAADILLYSPKLVPVGSDQVQHLELTAHLAQRFNNKYGHTFEIPEPLLPTVGAKIMSLTDPTKKMSKSDPNPKSFIALLDDPEQAVEKILRSKTDSENKIYVDEQKTRYQKLAHHLRRFN
ncbi:tryptophan--tRNA ligase [Mycoplasma sp. ATU-Cv-508]|uniref:tryptophan--tRNA ligase n=1 Tax=Mycoplasma sp. ATU-Cv-508 TaxID=2048001 RepID=UPI0031F2F9D9